MPSIRITRFAGLLPEVSPRLLREDHAQVAHNTLLWDGQLKAMPAWKLLSNAGTTLASFYADPEASFQFGFDPILKNAVGAFQEPFITDSVWGIDGGALKVRIGGGAPQLPVPIPTATVTSQIITNQNQSVYPVPRTYAVTLLSGNMESAPFVFPQLGADGTLFEGDVVTLTFTITNGAGVNATAIRLYRTIPGFDTAEQVGNPRETAFHLVAEIPYGGGSFIYADGQAASQILGDRCLTEQFQPPLISPALLGATESGWLVGATSFLGVPNASNQIQVSERFLWHSWPLQNLVSIPDGITDMAIFYDEVFFGTYMKPYHMRVAFSDNVDVDSLDLTVRPLTDTYACKPGSMVTTNFGAMYAAPDGLISLEVNEDQVATKKVTNPGDQLRNPVASISINSVISAAWWNGFYAGFCSGVGYLFNVETNHNNQFPLGQLVTFTTPAGVPGVSIVAGAADSFTPNLAAGLFVAWGNSIYSWPLPGYGYETATKLTYTWRSKVFVLPGGTTMAAAKVVNSDDGVIQVNFYGDGNLIYSYAVQDSTPFRVPHNHSCINWEIEMIGTGTVQEVHLSTSMRELTEEGSHD